ncbi:MAG: tyrosine-protein phosphatase [Lentisphaeria bacterium]|nr:tyrosine-protein phosphatase [Lentisphaeria bacterium]
MLATKKRKILFIIALLIIAAVGGRTYYFYQREIPRFRAVKENVLYRSGQCRGIGLDYMKSKGIKTIINLRSPDKAGSLKEKEFAKENGIKYINHTIGINLEEMYKTSALFMKIMNDPKNLPVLVHCSRGKERSGIMSAVYLMEKEGWSRKEALEETFRLGLTKGRMPLAETFLLEYNPEKHDTHKELEEVMWLE